MIIKRTVAIRTFNWYPSSSVEENALRTGVKKLGPRDTANTEQAHKLS